MALLIKDMEMPKSCGVCEYNRQRNGWVCVATLFPYRWKPIENPLIRPNWCPLTEIPNHPTPDNQLLEDAGFEL